MKHATGQSTYEVMNKRHMQELHIFTVEGLFPAGGLPLFVHSGGSSVWEHDVCIRKRNCGDFFVEIITAGNLVLVQDGREYLIEPRMVFLNRLGADLTYQVGPAGFVHKRFVGIKGTMLESILAAFGIDKCDVCRISKPGALVSLLRRAFRLIRQRDPGAFLQLAALAYEVLLRVAFDMVGPKYPTLIRHAIEYLHMNINREVSIRELSQAVGLSTAHLYRLFAEHVHETPMELFTKARMDHAATLLAQTGISIKEITSRVGYEEPSYFCKVFRKTMGCAPGAYRARMQGTANAGDSGG
jgi:AraC-like DNA-binding protein